MLPACINVLYFVRLHCVQVETQNVTRACVTVPIPTINNMFPGPTVHVNAGDTVVITVTSKVDDPITIHW